VSKILIAVALLMVSTFVGPKNSAPGDCLSGRRDALVAGGFSGTTTCSGEDVTLQLVGTTRSGHAIYDYRYRVMAAAVMHGGQRIVTFKGPDYVGQYALSPPPYSTVRVDGTRVLVETHNAFTEDAVLDFSNGPPSQVFVGGNMTALYR
jgi:hypothetical protein